MLCEHLMYYRIPTTKCHLAPDGNSAKADKPLGSLRESHTGEICKLQGTEMQFIFMVSGSFRNYLEAAEPGSCSQGQCSSPCCGTGQVMAWCAAAPDEHRCCTLPQTVLWTVLLEPIVATAAATSPQLHQCCLELQFCTGSFHYVFGMGASDWLSLGHVLMS